MRTISQLLNPSTSTDQHLHPARLRRWLEELSPFTPLTTLAELLDALRELNAREMGPGERVALLDLHRREALELFDAFETTSFHQSLHTGRDRSRVRNDLGRLVIEVANGYKLAVTAYAAGRRSAHDDPSYRHALYVACEQTVLSLLHAFRTYGPVPRKAYNDLHQLFRLAEQQRALYQVVTIDGKPAPSQSIGKLYKQLMLLAISDPYHMGRGEARALFLFMADYVTTAEIKRNGDCGDNAVGQFLVDLDGDGPPCACGSPRQPASGPETRIMDLRQVVTRVLRDQVNRDVSPEHRLTAEHARRVLGSIIPRLRGSLKRREQRNPVHWRAQVVVTLPAIHAYLTARMDTPPPSAGTPTRAADRPLEDWSIIEHSIGGYRLFARETHSELEVGDLLGIVDNTAGGPEFPLRVGWVRWLQIDKSGGLLVGAEKLSPHTVAVECRREDEATGISGLLVPGNRRAGNAATLVLPSGTRHVEEDVIIIRDGRSLPVKLTERLGGTPCHELFKMQASKQDSESR